MAPEIVLIESVGRPGGLSPACYDLRHPEAP